jgi:NitT/TauT family transport system substrate-binding protein
MERHPSRGTEKGWAMDNATRRARTAPIDARRRTRGRRSVAGLAVGLAAALALLAASPAALAQEAKIRVGHFPNVTHVQALVARNMERQGRPWFSPERLGSPGLKIEWYVYNAGPSAMEAIFADTLDLTYVGPSPAINAYARSRGEEVRVVAGGVNGGSALVVRPDAGLNGPADFRGKRIATPQLGNTQDVNARAWLVAGGLRITQAGGDAQVLPTANPDQLALFQRREVDAVWTVEPWVSRLEEIGGRVLVEEDDAITTVLVSSARLLSSKRDLVRRFAAAHRELTDWINEHPEDAQRMVREELRAVVRAEVSPDLIARAWRRMTVTAEVSPAAFQEWMVNAQRAGFLRTAPDLSRLVEAP